MLWVGAQFIKWEEFVAYISVVVNISKKAV